MNILKKIYLWNIFILESKFENMCWKYVQNVSKSKHMFNSSMGVRNETSPKKKT